MSKFPEFYSIGSLSIDFSDSISRNATIFGNGRNQVAITIKLSLLDKGGHAVPVPESVLREAVYLCDYRTGKKLPDNNFFYSKEKNDYCNAIFGSKITDLSKKSDSNFTTIELYVSANGISDGKLISCGINIDDIGDVDTSENGTGNKLPNGDPYLHQNYVTVESLSSIYYTKKGEYKISIDRSPNREKSYGNQGRYRYSSGKNSTTEEILWFKFHCDNYYVSAKFNIVKVIFHDYKHSQVPEFICGYDSESNNQHMIVAHPYNKEKKKNILVSLIQQHGMINLFPMIYLAQSYLIIGQVLFALIIWLLIQEKHGNCLIIKGWKQ